LSSKNKIRILSLALIGFGAAAGIFSRQSGNELPGFIALYAGDTFWAFSAFFLIKFFVPALNPVQNSLSALLFSFFIEITQLIHFPALDQIRSTFAGGLALGFGFHWQDLICYVAGVLLASICNLLIFNKLK